MSSFPYRGVEIWRSSLAEQMTNINGVFVFYVTPSGMVPQLLEFLGEGWKYQNFKSAGPILKSFIEAERERSPQWGPVLLQQRSFPDYQGLFAVTMDQLQEDVRQLELHADLNLTFNRVQFLAWTGAGHQMLMEMHRRQFIRGIGFEIEAREALNQSINSGDVPLSGSDAAAFQHYSTGLGLLAGEDHLTGLLDAAFMQFYLAAECILGKHKVEEAIESGAALFGISFTPDLECVVRHIYDARHMYFGHGHPKQLKGRQSVKGAFSIAKQVLVARWCARTLMNLALRRPLLKREMRLYMGLGGSIEFNGNADSLKTEFAL